MSDFVFCDKCGIKQREKDGPICREGEILCKSCWREAVALENTIPQGCRACGGDYPNCKDSCNLFDN